MDFDLWPYLPRSTTIHIFPDLLLGRVNWNVPPLFFRLREKPKSRFRSERKTRNARPRAPSRGAPPKSARNPIPSIPRNRKTKISSEAFFFFLMSCKILSEVSRRELSHNFGRLSLFIYAFRVFCPRRWFYCPTNATQDVFKKFLLSVDLYD